MNQAVKAVVIARKFLERDGPAIVCIPSFVKLNVDRHERTAVRFTLKQVPQDSPWVAGIEIGVENGEASSNVSNVSTCGAGDAGG